MNMYWHEQNLLLHSEFRDGNVPASFELLRILKESLLKLPRDVQTIYLRSDSAGYQEELLRYCAEQERPIQFAIAVRVSASFKEAALSEHSTWHPLKKFNDDGSSYETGQEWAEVCFVPAWVAIKKTTPEYRYIAIREKMEPLKKSQREEELPFQTIAVSGDRYKLFGVVTNRDLPANELIQWHRERCGDSEKVHSTQKNELAGGQLPSKLFGANAAWWHIMILAFNLNQLMKQHALPHSLSSKRLKALRFQVINVAGRLLKHARQHILRLSGGEERLKLFTAIRANIQALTIQVNPSG